MAEPVIIVSVLVAIVVTVLAIVIAGFWIYLCCGKHRDLVWKRYEPDPMYPQQPLRVVISSGGGVMIDSAVGSEAGFSDEVSLQPSIIAPITRKPTVRKNKLFASQPDLGFHQNLSQSLGRLMESEPASHYQLSLDETDELLVDQGMFEIEQYDAEPHCFSSVKTADDKSIELAPIEFEPLNDQKNQPRSSSTPDVRETINDQTNKVVGLQPLYPSSPAILDDSPADRVLMQSESRDGDLEGLETSSTHNIINDHEKPKPDSEVSSAASNSRDNSQVSSTVEVMNNDDTTADGQNDQLKENDEGDIQTKSSITKNGEVVIGGESKEDSELSANDNRSDKEVEEETTGVNEEVASNVQEQNLNLEVQSQEERPINENTSTDEVNERTPSGGSDNEVVISDQKSDEESGKGLNDNGEKEMDSMSEQQEEERKISKDSLEEYDGDESVNASSSGSREDFGQEQHGHSPTLSNANTSAQVKRSENEEMLVEETNPPSFSDLKEMFQKIGNSPTSSPTAKTKYKPLHYPKQNILQSGLDTSGSETSLDTTPSSDSIQQEGSQQREEILAGGTSPKLNGNEQKQHNQGISSLATVIHKAPLLTNVSDENESESSEVNLATTEVQTIVPKVAERVTTSEGNQTSEGNEEEPAQQPIRKRRPTPAPVDRNKFQHQLLQSSAAVSALVGSTRSKATTTNPFLGSITEEAGGFKEEDEEELDSTEDEGYTKF